MKLNVKKQSKLLEQIWTHVEIYVPIDSIKYMGGTEMDGVEIHSFIGHNKQAGVDFPIIVTDLKHVEIIIPNIKFKIKKLNNEKSKRKSNEETA